jgi:hypothetical protein
VVEAAPAQRLVQFAAPVRGQHHQRPPYGGERAQLGHRDRELAEELEQQRLELVVGPVDLVDQQHRRYRPGVPYAAQDRPLRQELGGEQVGVRELLLPGLGQPDRHQLALMIPLVQGLGRSQSLVALQPDQRSPERLGNADRGRGLAHPGLALDEQRPAERGGQVQRHRRTLVGQVVDRVEPALHVVGAVEGHRPSRASSAR